MEKYTLTKELQEDLFKIRAKVDLNSKPVEQNPAFFTQNDRAVMAAAYNELTNKKPCWNCSGFMSKIRLSLTNYFKWYDQNEMEKIQIEDRELKPVEEMCDDRMTIKSIAFDLEALTLSELREFYPHIKSNSKAKFIQKIKEDGK